MTTVLINVSRYWAIPIVILTPLLRNLGISRGGGALTLEFSGERCINFKFPGEGYINLGISRKGGIQALECQGGE
jgi:hypothetical protein